MLDVHLMHTKRSVLMVFGIAHVINNFLGNIGWCLKGICWELFLWKLLVFFGYYYVPSDASRFDFHMSFGNFWKLSVSYGIIGHIWEL